MSNMKITGILIGVIFLGIIGAAFITSMDDGEPGEQATNEQVTGGEDMLQGTTLEDYEPREEVTELEVIDLEEGSGEVVPENAVVVAHYTGALAENGTIFESSHDRGEPATFGLNEVIEGWGEGVPGMKVGGTRRLVIPSDLAYGPNPPPGSIISANDPLVFDITIVGLNQ